MSTRFACLAVHQPGVCFAAGLQADVRCCRGTPQLPQISLRQQCQTSLHIHPAPKQTKAAGTAEKAAQALYHHQSPAATTPLSMQGPSTCRPSLGPRAAAPQHQTASLWLAVMQPLLSDSTPMLKPPPVPLNIPRAQEEAAAGWLSQAGVGGALSPAVAPGPKL